MRNDCTYATLEKPEWNAALDAHGYKGCRKLKTARTREPARDDTKLVQQAKELYLNQRRNGKTHKHAVSTILSELGAETPHAKKQLRRRINRWCDRYDWEESIDASN